MDFRLTINCDNAAFQSEAGDDWATTDEVARILEDTARKLRKDSETAFDYTLKDSNGNTVGKAEFTN